MQFLGIFLLKLEVCLVGSALVVAEEATEVYLVEGISVGKVGGAGESGIERAIAPDQLELHAVEIAANWVKPLPAAFRTLEFHACCLETEGAVLGSDFVLCNFLDDGGVGEAVLELYAVIPDLN